jgi:hypothetical protein
VQERPSVHLENELSRGATGTTSPHQGRDAAVFGARFAERRAAAHIVRVTACESKRNNPRRGGRLTADNAWVLSRHRPDRGSRGQKKTPAVSGGRFM